MVHNKYEENDFQIDDLNILRAFAILLVVLRHCFAPFMGIWPVSSFYEYSFATDVIGKYISTISMPLFVFISGFLYSYLRNNLKKYPTFKILLKKKTARLLRPYFILAPIYIYFFVDYTSNIDFLNHLWKGAGHLWFLLMIFTVFMLFYPLENYLKQNPIKSFIVIIFLFFLYPGFSVIEIYPLSKFFHYLPFFYIGYLFHYKNKFLTKLIKDKFWLLFIIHSLLFIASFSIPEFIENGILKTLFKAYIILPTGLVSVSMLYVLFTNAKNLNKIIPRSIVTYLNKTSYYIYLIHQPLLLLFFQQNFLHDWSPVYVISLAFFSVIIISILFGNILLEFYWGKKLIGAA